MLPGVFMVRLKRFVEFAAGHVVGGQEGHAHAVETGLNRNARRGAAVAGGVRDFLIPIEELHAFAIDGDFELLALDAAQDSLEVTGHAFDLKGVFAVGGELIFDQDAAAGSERQPFNVIVLRGVGGDFEDGLGGAETSPIARRLIFPAADRYASISAGESVRAPAMLSKPCVESSPGRNFVASTCSARTSRIAFVYSVRLSRCRPGGGSCVFAPRSSSFSIQVTSASTLAASGRGIPDGGIIPARSLRTTFSPISAWSREMRQVQLVQVQVGRLDLGVVAGRRNTD